MKRKILFNVALIIGIIFYIYLIVIFSKNINSAISGLLYMKENYDEFNSTPYVRTILQSSFILFFCILLFFFNFYFLVYINKNDITELAKSTKEIRLQKSEEKKQQQIKELEEKLKQLKKDE